MSRVICVSKEEPVEEHPDLIIAAAILEVGAVYNVVEEWNDMCELAEFPHPRQIFWLKKNFIPCSDISETTFERNFVKEKV